MGNVILQQRVKLSYIVLVVVISLIEMKELRRAVLCCMGVKLYKLHEYSDNVRVHYYSGC